MLARILPHDSNFYPRSPCGERLLNGRFRTIHNAFLSTLSLRRATPRGGYCYLDNIISIHALLAESDLTSVVSSAGTTDFYPRSPCGERLHEPSPCRGHNNNFYPRSPCGERPNQTNTKTYQGDFYPRSPCGERHADLRRHRGNDDFYPRSPCGERPLRQL